MPNITSSRRVKRTPFSEGVEAANVNAYTVYNHMLLATEFESVIEDYHHLKQHVQLWDVACEKVLRVYGDEAEKLIRLVSPRDISKTTVGQCIYVPLIDRTGGILNDPVILNISPNEFWICLADSDYIHYLLGVSGALHLNVQIDEPDISILAVQGPKSEELMHRVFGEKVRKIAFFRFKELEAVGEKILVSRSGYSKQGGFEVYVPNQENCMPIWKKILKAGEDLNVRVGCPNVIERIEGGLLSYGNDITRENTPFEAGLGKYVNSPEDFIGKQALLDRPFNQIIKPVLIEGEIPPCDRAWPAYQNDELIGHITSAAFSPDFKCNVSIGMMKKLESDTTISIQVETQIGIRLARIQKTFWK